MVKAASTFSVNVMIYHYVQTESRVQGPSYSLKKQQTSYQC